MVVDSNKENNTSEEFLSTGKAAKIAGVTSSTIWRWIHEAGIEVHKTRGGHNRIRRDVFDKFFAEINEPKGDEGP